MNLMSRVKVANAPVSYGAFEVTVGTDADVPSAEEVLDEIAGSGYDGVDLGPLGYLGRDGQLVSRLQQRGLSLAGGFLEIPFSVPEELPEGLKALDALLDELDAVGEQELAPVPTLADAVRAVERSRWPGRAATDPSIGLDDAAWPRFADGVNAAADRCRSRGYEPSFHHHTGSYVEAVWEIERLLELTDVGLCLDTGHLLLGWGDPITAINDWRDRINHLHLKDAHVDILEGIVKEEAPLEAVWDRRAFCALGQGDIEFPEVLRALDRVDYEGWIVVEQDVIVQPDDPPNMAARDQRSNREYLRTLGI